VETLDQLATRVRACRLCEAHLPLGPRPVFRVSTSARILVAAPAPGTRVHETGIPFNDPSGDRLRDWMGVDRDTFYDERRIAIVPMGFCYPGRGKSGDRAPRRECAPAWRQLLLDRLSGIELTLVIGQYAHAWHFDSDTVRTLTERVRDWRSFGTAIVPLPHPSPRNNLWLRRNPWFAQELLPELKTRVARTLDASG
jgi:uracil-DNA glycosylase